MFLMVEIHESGAEPKGKQTNLVGSTPRRGKITKTPPLVMDTYGKNETDGITLPGQASSGCDESA